MTETSDNTTSKFLDLWKQLSRAQQLFAVLFLIMMIWVGPPIRDGVTDGINFAGARLKSIFEKSQPSEVLEDARGGKIAYIADVNQQFVEFMDKNTECVKSMSKEYRSSTAFNLGKTGYTVSFLICDTGDIYYEISKSADFADAAMWFIDRSTIESPWIKKKKKSLENAAAVPISRDVGKSDYQPAASPAYAAILPLLPATGGHTRMTPIPAQFQIVVICQKPVGDGRGIFRRIQTPQGCFDQIVDGWNGMIVRSQSAPCAPC